MCQSGDKERAEGLIDKAAQCKYPKVYPKVYRFEVGSTSAETP